MTTATATDVWSELEDGRGWSPARVRYLRVAVSPPDALLGRDEFGKLVGTGERSVYRWETGSVKNLTMMAGRALAQLAKDRLNPAQLVELCLTE